MYYNTACMCGSSKGQSLHKHLLIVRLLGILLSDSAVNAFILYSVPTIFCLIDYIANVSKVHHYMLSKTN